MEGGKPTVIANAEGFRTTPSVVAYTNQDQLVGELQTASCYNRKYFSAKRLLVEELMKLMKNQKK